MRKEKKHRLINGSKGLVSLLLVVTLLPFYALVATITEVARYQASVKAVDQAIGSSAVSTLGNYDTFLLDRFGLLAMSQDKDYTYKDSESSYINDTFSGYLNRHKTFSMGAADVKEVRAEGVYPLGNVSFLKQQVLQAGSATVPTRLVMDAVDYNDFLKGLEKMLDFGAITSLLSSGTEMLDNEVNMIDKFDDIDRYVQKIGSDSSKYRQAFEAWEDAAEAYQTHHAAGPPAAEAEEGEEGEEEDSGEDWETEDQELLEKAEKAKEEYLKQIGTIQGDVNSLNTSLDSAVQSKTKFESSVVSFGAQSASSTMQADVQDQKADTDRRKAEIDASSTLTDEQKKTLKGQLDKAQTGYKDLSGHFQEAEAKLGQSAKDLNSTAEDALKHFDSSEIEGYARRIDQLKADVEAADASEVPGSDLYVDVSELASLESVQQFEKKLEESMDDKASFSYIKNLVDIISTLVDTSILYDTNLDTTILSSVYSARPSARDKSRAAVTSPYEASDSEKSMEYWKRIRDDYYGPEGYAEPQSTLERLISQLMDYVQELKDAADACEAARKPKEKLEAIVDMGEAVLGILGCITLAGVEVTRAASEIIATAIADRIMIMGYLTYNLPNRTNYTEFIPKGGINTATDVSGWNLVPFIGSYLDGGLGVESYSFSGAELEYIFWGDKRERQNQINHFMAMAFVRLFIDAFSIVANEEVNSIFEALSAIPYVGPVLGVIYIVAVVLGEPLLDTYILANGGSEPIVFKETIYLTPSGIFDAIQDIVSVSLYNEEQKKDFQEKTGQSVKNGIKKLDNKVRSKLEMAGNDREFATQKGINLKNDTSTAKGTDTVKKQPGKAEKFFKGYFDGLQSKNYTEHTLLMGLLLFSSDTKLRRFQDIITMERLQYNHTGFAAKVSNSVTGEYSDFDIDRAYTMLRANVKGELKSVLPVPRTSSFDPYSFDRVMYRGY